MKMCIVLVSALLAGPCSSASSDEPGATPSATATSAAATAAAATATGAPTAAATAVAVTPHANLPAGPCAQLAQKCKKCPPGAVLTACNGALTAGGLDQSACTNALNDKDIKSQCGGGTSPTPTTTPSTAPTPTVAPPAPPGGGPCAQLAQKCPKCPAGVVQLACNGALTAGSLDPSACTNALNDKDIKGKCN